jgi:hypothetical protein
VSTGQVVGSDVKMLAEQKQDRSILILTNDLRAKSMKRDDWSSCRKRWLDAYRTKIRSILALTNDLSAKSMKRDDYVGY